MAERASGKMMTGCIQWQNAPLGFWPSPDSRCFFVSTELFFVYSVYFYTFTEKFSTEHF